MNKNNSPKLSQEIQNIASKISSSMEAADKARESALPLHRLCIKEASLTIRAVHRNEFEQAQEHLQRSREYMEQSCSILRPFPMIYYAGFLQDAQKEFCEATLTYSVVTGAPLPSPSELGVDDAPYANGMAECVGELRRHTLDYMRNSQLEEAEALLGTMEEIFFVLTTLDFPDAITRGLRRSTDIARGCLEKTRGELTTAFGHRRLEETIKKALERQ